MLFDYITLKIIWWFLVGAVLIIFASTAGTDYGVTMMLPFMRRKATFAENDAERRVMLNTVAATWDGNFTWLVFGGGCFFVIWPVIYGTVFSGFYWALLLVLWSFAMRPPGFDYRSKIHTDGWRKNWDILLGLSGFVPLLIFGVALGNLFVGLPISFDKISMRNFYSGDFWMLLNPFGIICGVGAVLMGLMQGAAHLNRRTEGDLKRCFQRVHAWSGLAFLLVFIAGGILLATVVTGYHLVSSPADPTAMMWGNVVTKSMGGWITHLNMHPMLWFIPAAVFVFVILSILTRDSGWFSFWMSSLAIAATIGTIGVTLFPFLVPSSVAANESLTVWNAVSSQFSLMGMFYIGLIMLIIIFTYKLWAFRVVWRKKHTLSAQDVAKESHTFY